MAAATETPIHYDIPKTYKAAVYDNPGSISTKIEELNTPEPGPGEVLVRLTHSGVCHSDLGVMQSSWKTLPYPTQKGQVGGHEGVGIVQKLGLGAEQSRVKLGDRVGIKWVASACGSCPPCMEGRDAVCFYQKVSGYYYPGTFQQYAIAPANYVTPIPDGLSSQDAAPMLCAGITTYSALRRSGAQSGQWVVIAGAGGGLGHLACQIGSRGMAYRILGVDHGSKEQFVKECGAEAFIDVTKFDDTTIAEEVKRITGGLGASAVIVCTSSNKAYAQAVNFLRFGGTVVCVGIPEGDLVAIATAFPGLLVGKELVIKGSATGNNRDAMEVLEMAARGIVKTRSRLEKMDKLTEVFQEMSDGKMQGRVVLDLE
ncbi:alcohol dehydrogenase-like protein [Xylogone sp. PMI_703]|nr:alcohol dehydrogenase-like protein [Xylogone sp. PMI_703]